VIKCNSTAHKKIITTRNITTRSRRIKQIAVLLILDHPADRKFVLKKSAAGKIRTNFLSEDADRIKKMFILLIQMLEIRIKKIAVWFIIAVNRKVKTDQPKIILLRVKWLEFEFEKLEFYDF